MDVIAPAMVGCGDPSPRQGSLPLPGLTGDAGCQLGPDLNVALLVGFLTTWRLTPEVGSEPGLPLIDSCALPTTSHSEASQGRVDIFQGLCSISRKFSLKRKFQPCFSHLIPVAEGDPWRGGASSQTGQRPLDAGQRASESGGLSLVSQALCTPTGRWSAQTPDLLSETGSTTLLP